jgi:catechol 2,3-dioxygenase-like lactoylglutathione lyase family enzyme
MATITRRDVLVWLPALSTVFTRPLRSIAAAQDTTAALRVRSLNHFGIAVADAKRSIEFYQGLFGMPVQARDGATTILRVGPGPQFLSIQPVAAGAAPSITHYCLGLEAFSVDRVLAALARKGVTRGNTVAPLKVRVTNRDGRDDLLFGDPDGIVCQLQDVSYCGGAGALGNKCSVEPPSAKGVIQLSDLSHLTIFSGDAQRSNAFYRDLFGLSIRSYQGPTAPTLAVGPAAQFLMFTGGGGGRGAAAAPRPASINHACFSLDRFNPDEIVKTLERYGLKPREGGPGPAGPLRHYITMRMENRGGAPGGTPELYFTDPDGLLMQLQDTSYCGGSGLLGNECGR